MPEREWILLNPGPANTTRSVREALVMPDLCHREPEFFEMMRECRARLVRLAGCDERFAAVLFSGSGTAAVEAAVSSVVPKDRAVLIVSNGVYGDRLAGSRGSTGSRPRCSRTTSPPPCPRPTSRPRSGRVPS